MIQTDYEKKQRMHYGWAVVFGGFLTQIILLISLQTLPIVLAEIKTSLSLDNASAGTITSVFGLCYAGFSFFWGFLSDKIGTRKTLTIAGLLSAVMLILFGLTADSFAKALIIYALVGFGAAGIYSATIPKLIGEWFDPSKRGRAMSLITPGGVLTGAALGIVAPIFATNYGWQTTFIILGVVALVVTIAVLLIVRNKPAEKGLLPVGAPPMAEGAAEAGSPGGETKSTFGSVLKLKITWHLGSMYIFWQLAYMAIIAFLAVAIRGAGFTPVEAGLAVTIYNLCQLVGQQIWGPLSDRIERKYVITISSIWWLVFAVGFVLAYGSGLTVLYIMVGLMGIGLGNVPVLLATFSDYYPKEIRGTGTGVISTLAVIGRFFGPMVAGALADASGKLTSVFIFAAIMMLVASLIALTLPRLRGQKA